MNTSNNFNELKSEQSWLKAEKMLDRHFRNKRIVTWSLVFFISGLIVSSVLLMNHYSEKNNGTTANQNTLQIKTPAQKESVVSTENIPSQAQPVALVSNKNLLPAAPANHIKTSRVHQPLTKPNSIQSSPTQNKSQINRDVNSFALNSKNSPVILKDNSSLQPEATLHSTAKQRPIVSIVPNSESAIDRAHSEAVVTVALQQSLNSVPLQLAGPLIEMKPIHLNGVPVATNSSFVSESKNLNAIQLPHDPFNLSIAVYGTAQYVTKKIESINYPEYVTRRNSEEDAVVTTGFGVSLLHDVKHFTISAGVAYASWGEKNKYVPYVNKKSTIENGTYQDYYRGDSNTVYIGGVVYYQPVQVLDSNFISHPDTVMQVAYDPSVLSANSENKFTYIEFPVELTYRFTRNKFGIGFSAGISPAMLVNKKGYTFRKDLSGIELIADNKSVNTFIVNGQFSVDLFYRMNDRINFMLRPQFRKNLNSVFASDYGVDQRYSSTGLVFGLQYLIR
jgi:hypothetical protein